MESEGIKVDSEVYQYWSPNFLDSRYAGYTFAEIDENGGTRNANNNYIPQGNTTYKFQFSGGDDMLLEQAYIICGCQVVDADKNPITEETDITLADGGVLNLFDKGTLKYGQKLVETQPNDLADIIQLRRRLKFSADNSNTFIDTFFSPDGGKMPFNANWVGSGGTGGAAGAKLIARGADYGQNTGVWASDMAIAGGTGTGYADPLQTGTGLAVIDEQFQISQDANATTSATRTVKDACFNKGALDRYNHLWSTGDQYGNLPYGFFYQICYLRDIFDVCSLKDAIRGVVGQILLNTTPNNIARCIQQVIRTKVIMTPGTNGNFTSQRYHVLPMGLNPPYTLSLPFMRMIIPLVKAPAKMTEEIAMKTESAPTVKKYYRSFGVQRVSQPIQNTKVNINFASADSDIQMLIVGHKMSEYPNLVCTNPPVSTATNFSVGNGDIADGTQINNQNAFYNVLQYMTDARITQGGKDVMSPYYNTTTNATAMNNGWVLAYKEFQRIMGRDNDYEGGSSVDVNAFWDGGAYSLLPFDMRYLRDPDDPFKVGSDSQLRWICTYNFPTGFSTTFPNMDIFFFTISKKEVVIGLNSSLITVL